MIKIIKEVSKEELKDFLYDINLSDKNLYDEVKSKKTIGTFQFSGNTAKRLLKDISPESFEEMVAINSLARPGSIAMAEPYLNGKKGGVSAYPKVMDSILKETNNTILFQEQIMAIFNVIGGFSLEDSNNIRGLMKKLGKKEKKKEDLEKWNKIVKQFVNGAIEKGITKSQAIKISEDMMAFSSYSFNKCFSEDCKIDRDNGSYWTPTIGEMYKIKNDYEWAKENGHKSLSEKYRKQGYGKAFSLNNDRLYINEIVDIYDSGKQEVFEISVESGEKIEVTINHKFPVVINNEIKEKSLKDGLKINDLLIINNGYEKSKKNTKGKLTRLEKIVSIKSLGIKQTYDVEMKAPYHTVSVNNIVAKNSHAVSYTYVAIMTLYLSYYFRKYYYSAILDYEIEKDGEVLESIKSVRNAGYELLPPDINLSKENMFNVNENQIIYGLMNIKFVGEKPTKRIIENRPYVSLFDFIIKTRSREVSSKVIKALISVGAFDKIENKDRKFLLYVLEKFWEKKKTIKVEEKLKKIYDICVSDAENMLGLKSSLMDLRKYEKEFFGNVIFTSVFSKDMIKAFKELSNKKLIYSDFDEVKGISKKIPVGVNSIRTIIDRNDNEMAFVEIEDLNNKVITIPIFASYWKFIKNEIFENTPYLLNVYKNEDSILFGEKSWNTNGNKILRMIKKL